MRTPSRWRLAFVLFVLCRTATAAVTGAIGGVVTDLSTHKPAAGVTVTVSGPSLQGTLTEFTDSAGRYLVTELPPGEYLVRFLLGPLTIQRPGVLISADKTVTVHCTIPPAQGRAQTYRI